MLSYLDTNNNAVGRHWWPIPETSCPVKLQLAGKLHTIHKKACY